MTTINLRNGLEVLYYFGEQDFNPQRNLLEDHSGYGRHATAKGGITIPSDDGSGNEVGANGPNDFSATSLDGVDDYFDVPDELSVLGQEFTVFAIHDYGGTIFDSDDGQGGFNLRSNQLSIRTSNDDLIRVQAKNVDTNVSIGRFDNGNLLYHDGREKSVRKTDVTAGQVQDSATLGVNNNLGFQTNGGKLSVFGCYSRAVSDAEIERIADLTAPLRAQL